MSLQTLMYHRVCSGEEWYPSPYVVTQSSFRRQMHYLRDRGFYTPGLSAILAGKIPERSNGSTPFLLTLDDGYLDNYTKAFPVLQEIGFTATIFLVADFSQRYNWWDVPYGTPRAELLGRGHIEEMARKGIEFGSHTMNHPRLPRLSDGDLVHELAQSRHVIEDIVQKPVVSLAYPYGASDVRVKSVVKNAGYVCAFGANTGPLSLWSDPFDIRRLNVENATGPIGMKAKMSGAEKSILWAWWKGKTALQRF